LEPYTQLDQQAIEQITKQYPITPVTHFRPLEGGSENSNYYLTSKDQAYVLTICESKTLAETEALAKLLFHLEKHQFTTTQIVRNKEEGMVSVFQGKPILLKSFLKGKVVEEFSDSLLVEIGASIAQLNQIPAPDYLPKQCAFGIEFFGQLADHKIEHPFVGWLKEMEQYIQANFHPDLPKGLIHGDIFYNNVIVADRQLPIIMDFEEACDYYRVFDLGMAIVGLCNRQGKIDLRSARQLIAGYQKVRPLLPIEKEKLKAFTVYAATATAFWRFRQFNVVVPDEARKDRYQEMQDIADQIFAIADQEFME
jgi:homoserine kinase type II